MATILEGNTDGDGRHIAVVVADFNRDITDALLEGCMRTLEEHGVGLSNITVVRVPGAFELPLACGQLAASGNFDALVALGCVIRGETPHFDYVAGCCARGLMHTALERRIPVAFGVLTTETLEQARHRSASDLSPTVPPGRGSKTGFRAEKTSPPSNKGAEAALSALQMASILEQL